MKYSITTSPLVPVIMAITLIYQLNLKYMWAYPGKAILILAFFTTTGFSCFKSRTHFDAFTVNCPKCDDFPGGYYQIILDDGNTTTVRLECNSTRKFNIQHNTEFDLTLYLDRNGRCSENNTPLGAAEIGQEIGEVNITEPPMMDLLDVKINATDSNTYEFYYSQDQCTQPFYNPNSTNPNLLVKINRDTTLTIAVVPDKNMDLKVTKRGEVIYDENLQFQRSKISIEL